MIRIRAWDAPRVPPRIIGFHHSSHIIYKGKKLLRDPCPSARGDSAPEPRRPVGVPLTNLYLLPSAKPQPFIIAPIVTPDYTILNLHMHHPVDISTRHSPWSVPSKHPAHDARWTEYFEKKEPKLSNGSGRAIIGAVALTLQHALQRGRGVRPRSNSSALRPGVARNFDAFSRTTQNIVHLQTYLSPALCNNSYHTKKNSFARTPWEKHYHYRSALVTMHYQLKSIAKSSNLTFVDSVIPATQETPSGCQMDRLHKNGPLQEGVHHLEQEFGVLQVSPSALTTP